MKKIFSLLVATGFVAQAFSTALTINNGGFEASGSSGCNNTVDFASSWEALRVTYDCHNCSTPTIFDDAHSHTFWAKNTDGCIGAPHSGNFYAEAECNGFGGSCSTADNSLIFQSMSNNASSSTCYRATAYVKSLQGFAVSSILSIAFLSGTGLTDAAIVSDLTSGTGSYPTPTFTDAGNGWYAMTVDWTPPSTGAYTIVIGNMLNRLCDDSNTTLCKWILDDVSITCLADAGPDTHNTDRNCCVSPEYTSVQIGTNHSCTDNSYSWSPSATLSCTTCQQPSATPTVNTNYTLTVTGAYCLTGTDVVHVTVQSYSVSCCNGGNGRYASPHTNSKPGDLTNAESNQDVSIFPNPNNGVFTIKVGDGVGSVSLIRIMDAQGKLVFEKSDAMKTISVDLSKYPRGNYAVNIEGDDNRRIVRNIIKE